MGSKDFAKIGVHNFFCDSCGHKVKSDEIQRDWRNLWVCDTCLDIRNPQEFLTFSAERARAEPIKPSNESGRSTSTTQLELESDRSFCITDLTSDPHCYTCSSTIDRYVMDINHLDTTGPSAPNVTGDASPYTEDARPTWTWTSSAGADGTGNFRYELDDSDLSSGATETTDLTFTPSSDLADGEHILYVQEKDKFGNWSSNGSFAITISLLCPISTGWTLAAASDLNSFTGATGFDFMGGFQQVKVCRDGDRIIVGVPGEDAAASNAGAVIVYSVSGTTWSLEQQINGAVSSNVQFGHGVGINKDGSVLCSCNTKSGQEEIRFYTRSGVTWSFDEAVTPSSVVTRFGYNCAMSYEGDVAVADSASNAVQDKVWIFTESGGSWSEAKVITPTMDASFSNFDESGFSLALSGDGKYLAVASYTGSTDVDIYYVDEGGTDNWGLQQTITGGTNGFGYSLSLSCDGSVLAVGEPDDTEAASGSVQIYERSGSTWSFVVAARPTSTATAYKIGSSVELSPDGKVLIVGSHQWNSLKGVVFILEDQDDDDVWVEDQKIEPSLSAGDNFGRSVSIGAKADGSNGWAIIGADGHSGGADNGKVFIYKVYS